MDPGPTDPAKELPPEGAAFTSIARPSRRDPIAIVLAAVALLAIAVATKQASPAPTPAPAVQASPPPAVTHALATAAPRGVELAAVPPPRNPTVSPVPVPKPEEAMSGTIQLALAGSTGPHVTVSLPVGWQRAGDAGYEKPPGAAGPGLSIGVWQLHHVYVYPCRWASEAYADPQLMQSAQGQAEALSSWWGQDPTLLPYWNSSIAPIARPPRSTTFQAHPAWYVEVLIPSGFDLSQCDGDQMLLWVGASGNVRTGVPGELHRLWAVNVDGDAVVIDAASPSVVSAADTAALERVVDSIVIGP
jgi:hypothetical protein